MIPSARWFPTSLAERAAWFQNFFTQFAKIALGLGFVQADIDAVEADNAMMQFLLAADTEIEAYSKAVTAYRKLITEGDVGQPTPDWPPAPVLVAPAGSETGVFERINDLRSLIMLKPGYTDEEGALLGILVAPKAQKPPADVKPSVQAFEAQTGSHFSVVVGNRNDATTWDVLIQRKGEGKWTVAKTASGKSVDVFVEPSVPGNSEQIAVRIQLLKGNLPYGQLSDIILVTINP